MKTVNETFDPSELEKMEIESENMEKVTGGNQTSLDVKWTFFLPEKGDSAIGSSEEMFDIPTLHIRAT